MRYKLLRRLGLLGVAFAISGVGLTGCLDEPDIPVIERMMTPLRIVNVMVDVENPPAVDVWIDSTRFANIGYTDVVDYTDIPSGTRFLRVTLSGNDTTEAILRGEIFLRSLTQTTMVLQGRPFEIPPPDPGDPDDQGGPSITVTQERFTYSDETAALPADSGTIKFIHCIVASRRDVKLGELDFRGIRMSGGEPVDTTFINNVFSPPVENTDRPNLSSFTKFPVGSYDMSIIFPTPRNQFSMEVERKRWTFIYSGILDAGQIKHENLLKLETP